MIKQTEAAGQTATSFERQTRRKVVLIDGNSLLYRAFYALPTTLTTSGGLVTNAAYGFTSMLIKLLEDEGWDAVAVAWDRGMSFRNERFAEYKAGRQPTPDILRDQIPIAREILECLNIPMVELEGWEADDILATLARRAEEHGHEVLVVTGDRDAFQLISSRVRVLTTRRGISDIVLYDLERLHERYGLPPEKIPDLLALKGDPSDNIPGVPGIGDKTAIKLLQAYGSVDELYERLSEVQPPRIREALSKHRDIVYLGKDIATLHFDMPLDLDLAEFVWEGWDEARVRQVFGALEFRTLMERLFALRQPAAVEARAAAFPYREITERELASLAKELGEGPVAIELRSEGGALSALALAQGRRIFYLSLGPGGLFGLAPAVVEFFSQEKPVKVFLDAKAAISLLRREGCEPVAPAFDVSVAAYLLDPAHPDYSLERLAAKYLDLLVPSAEQAPSPEAVVATRAGLVDRLSAKLKEELEQREQLALCQDIELPLLMVLADMEAAGVSIDQEHLAQLSSGMERRIDQLGGEIFELVGEEFNLNSPQQLSKIIFEKLGLKTRKRRVTSTGTGAAILYDMRDAHPVIDKILEYRELSKLKSTYLDALPRLVNPISGRLHTTFNQTVTATGRLSSSNPNLQNIPVRTELGLEIRKAFVPAKQDDLLLVADYAQIELRILAHLAGDIRLTEAFLEGEDIHRSTAAEVFGVEPEAVTSEMRRKAKAVNFGIVYGISPFGLAEQLGVEQEEAGRYIELYFSRYPQVQQYIQGSIARAYRDGYVTTLLGRRRYLPELKSPNYRVKSFGERLAVNTPIQGTAADLIKLAMVRLHRGIAERAWKSRMVLQVHDELVLEVTLEEKDAVAEFVRHTMEEVYPLHPPLVINMALGANWRDAK